jgi:hypothetical protein
MFCVLTSARLITFTRAAIPSPIHIFTVKYQAFILPYYDISCSLLTQIHILSYQPPVTAVYTWQSSSTIWPKNSTSATESKCVWQSIIHQYFHYNNHKHFFPLFRYFSLCQNSRCSSFCIFAKLPQASISFVMSVRPPIRSHRNIQLREFL